MMTAERSPIRSVITSAWLTSVAPGGYRSVVIAAPICSFPLFVRYAIVIACPSGPFFNARYHASIWASVRIAGSRAA